MTPKDLLKIKNSGSYKAVCNVKFCEVTLAELMTEVERLQILFAYTEGDLPGRVAAKALGANGFEMTLLIEAAVKAGEELARNGYPLQNESPSTP